MRATRPRPDASPWPGHDRRRRPVSGRVRTVWSGRAELSDPPATVPGVETDHVAYARLPSPVGPLGVAVTGAGLLALAFGDVPERALAARVPGLRPAEPREAAPALARVAAELAEYFAGNRRAFDVAVDWRASTGFSRRALRELAEAVGYGETIGYGELARRLVPAPGQAYDAARAVGRAMAGNPVAIVIPCHRVLASDGNLHGFGGGLEAKRRLLAREGVLPQTLDDVLAFDAGA